MRLSKKVRQNRKNVRNNKGKSFTKKTKKGGASKATPKMSGCDKLSIEDSFICYTHRALELRQVINILYRQGKTKEEGVRNVKRRLDRKLINVNKKMLTEGKKLYQRYVNVITKKYSGKLRESLLDTASTNLKIMDVYLKILMNIDGSGSGGGKMSDEMVKDWLSLNDGNIQFETRERDEALRSLASLRVPEATLRKTKSKPKTPARKAVAVSVRR